MAGLLCVCLMLVSLPAELYGSRVLAEGQKKMVLSFSPLPENVELLVWGAEEDKELLQQIFISFQAEYQGQANFYITYAPKSESSCKDSFLGISGRLV